MPGPLGNYLGWALANQVNQNPMSSYLQGITASAVPAKNALEYAQVEKAQNELEKERQLKQAMAGVDLSTPEGMKSGISAVGKVDPMYGLKLQAVMQSMAADSRKAFSETLGNGIKIMDSTLPGMTAKQYPNFYKTMTEVSPFFANQLMNPQEILKQDGSLDENKFNDWKTKALYGKEVIKESLGFDKQAKLELIKEKFRSELEDRKDIRQQKGFEQQFNLLNERQKMQGVEQKKEDLNAMIDGLAEGAIPPSMLSKRNTKGEYSYVLGEAQRRGLNLSKLQMQYEAAKKQVGTMNSQRMVTYRALADAIGTTVDRLNELADQMNLSGFKPLNMAEIKGKMDIAGNTEAGQLATQYVSQVNNLKEEFANIANLGYAPTESVWNLANRQINENYGVKQMHAALNEVKRAVNFRKTAIEGTGAWTPGGTQSTPQPGTNYPKTYSVPGGTATLVEGQTHPDGRPLYKFPDGSVRPATVTR
jgi:hypothetical protein